MPALFGQIPFAWGSVSAEGAHDGELSLAFVLGVLTSLVGLVAFKALKARVALAHRHRPSASALQNATDDPLAQASLGPAISAAIRSGELQLHYQPKLACRTMQVCGAEALSRWTPADGEVLPADEFVARAEKAGGIAELTIWSVEQALRDSAKLPGDCLGGPIYVNLSGKLITTRFVARLVDMIGHNAAKIGFEITETAVLDNPEEALGCLRTLRDAGMHLAIDDYGAGNSSLTYLKQIPASELKIDRKFIQGMIKSNRDPLIVRSTIDLCHALGMKVTAEGVEDAMTASLLRMMGCDTIQGYFVSKAVSIGELVQFVGEHAGNAPQVPQIYKISSKIQPG